MAGRDVLVTGKPQSLHQVFHNTPELAPVEASVLRVKGDDHVIGAIAARAGVLRVHGLDESARELEVTGPGHAKGTRSPAACRFDPECSGRVGESLGCLPMRVGAELSRTAC